MRDHYGNDQRISCDDEVGGGRYPTAANESVKVR